MPRPMLHSFFWETFARWSIFFFGHIWPWNVRIDWIISPSRNDNDCEKNSSDDQTNALERTSAVVQKGESVSKASELLEKV
jgi:hypothetical protein